MPKNELLEPKMLDSPESENELTSKVEQILDSSRVYDAYIYGWFDKGEYKRHDRTDTFALLAKEREHKKLTKFAQEHQKAFEELTSLGVDCFHATTTLNAEALFQHGIVPSGLFSRLGITAIGKENFTQPPLRSHVHVVPVAHASATIRYAEGRLEETAQEYVNPKNYPNFLHFLDRLEEGKPASKSIEAYFRGHGEEAVRIQKAVEAGELHEGSGAPLVFGIDSSKISEQAKISYCASSISGDTTVEQTIGFDMIPLVYTSAEAMKEVEEMLEKFGHQNTVVRDIAEIR